MALLQVNMYSMALCRSVTFHVILPNDVLPMLTEQNPYYDRQVKTLYLLHGFTGDSLSWLTGSQIQELSTKYNLAVVMPAGENSFFLNGKGTGRSYETFVGQELPDYCQRTFGLPDRPEDNYIGGLSMGGFGAIHTALKYPERYGKMFGLSSALIINEIKNLKPGEKNNVADYDYYTQNFGTLGRLDESENNPEYLILERKKKGESIQPIFMACGTEDFLLNANREFRDFLVEEGVKVTYKESTGMHEWKFWNEYLETAVQWLINDALESSSGKVDYKNEV